MRSVAALVTVLLGLAAAACSPDSTTASVPDSVPSATPTVAAITTTTAPPCSDFMDNYFIGSPPSKANEATSYGWTFTLWDKAGSTGWDTSEPWEIAGVEKDKSKCTVRFELVLDGPITPPAPAVPAGPLTTVSDGTYLVGTDMEPGTYKSPGSRGCYWARMKDDAGQDIIANNISDGPARFTAKKGEFVKINRCTFTKV